EISIQIEEFLQKEEIIHLTNLPYNENFTKAMTLGQTIMEYPDQHLKDSITKSWNAILQHIN
ncbi:MAG: (4Fe-4S)-binding protein, partial [Marinilabiliales bacterium]